MIEAFLGLPGAGKTYNMTRAAYLKAIKGKHIYANYKLDFGEKLNKYVHYFKELPEVYGVKNAIILIDEAGIFMPAQSWRSIPFEFMRFIRQHRHDGLDLWYTAQDMQDVATSLRRVTQFAHSFNRFGKFVKKRTINPHTKERYSFDLYYLSSKYFKMYDTTENIDLSDYIKENIKESEIKNRLKKTVI